MDIPSREAIADKLVELVVESAEPTGEVTADAPLISALGLDSLDIIELGFSIQEHFDFAFSDKNAIDELDKVLGGEVILKEGRLTEQGRTILLERMPELGAIELPDALTVHELQQYYTVNTFARLIEEFYASLPEAHPETGEPLEIRDFRVRTVSGGEIPLPDGDALVDAWVATTAARMKAELGT